MQISPSPFPEKSGRYRFKGFFFACLSAVNSNDPPRAKYFWQMFIFFLN